MTDAEGTPLADATVYVLDAEGNALLSGQTHADGMYEIAGIPPGAEYRMKATRVGFESKFNENHLDVEGAPAITVNNNRG